MIETPNRNDRMFIGILVLTIVGLSAGVAYLSIRDTIEPVAPALGAVAGGLVAARAIRADRRSAPSPDAGLSTRQSVALGVGAGAASLVTLLSATWQATALAFGDAFLILFLGEVVLRARRGAHGDG